MINIQIAKLRKKYKKKKQLTIVNRFDFLLCYIYLA